MEIRPWEEIRNSSDDLSFWDSEVEGLGSLDALAALDAASGVEADGVVCSSQGLECDVDSWAVLVDGAVESTHVLENLVDSGAVRAG